jgi:hypothetical protein
MLLDIDGSMTIGGEPITPTGTGGDAFVWKTSPDPS